MTKTGVRSMVALGLIALGCTAAERAEERSFHFAYAVRVDGPASPSRNAPEVREVRKVRIWVPLPSSDSTQTITDLRISAPIPYRETRDSIYGNRIAYLEATELPAEGISIEITFDVRRLEARLRTEPMDPSLRARLLAPDRLVEVDGEVAERARRAAEGASAPEETSRRLYEAVLAQVDYDKTGTGWGRGDTRYVCRVGRGNCSDFHSLFIGMARSRGIPSVFEIGFPLPSDRREGEIGGYHCWAWYEEAPGLWRPVDASEADKDPSRTDYFFGALCPNRVAFTRGRDLTLDPPQEGAPLNFFVDPYVEIDGKAGVARVERKVSFVDLGS